MLGLMDGADQRPPFHPGDAPRARYAEGRTGVAPGEGIGQIQVLQAIVGQFLQFVQVACDRRQQRRKRRTEVVQRKGHHDTAAPVHGGRARSLGCRRSGERRLRGRLEFVNALDPCPVLLLEFDSLARYGDERPARLFPRQHRGGVLEAVGGFDQISGCDAVCVHRLSRSGFSAVRAITLRYHHPRCTRGR